MKPRLDIYSFIRDILIVIILAGAVSCSSEKKTYEAYSIILSKCISLDCERDPGAVSGQMSGKAKFSYGLENKTITVKYGFLPANDYIENMLLENYNWYSEKGSLSSMSVKGDCGLKDKSKYYPVSIQGRWQPQGTGGGDLIVTLSKNNRLAVHIFGDGNFHYWDTFQLDSSDADFILGVLNEAYAKSNSSKKQSTFFKKLKGETVFYYEKDNETVFLEFNPRQEEKFYEYVVKDGMLDSRSSLKFDDEFLGSGKYVNLGKLIAKRGKVIYKPEDKDEKTLKFKPAGSKLDDLKITELPGQFQWLIGRWVDFSDNNYSYEFFPDGHYDYQFCKDGELSIKTTGDYFIKKTDEESIKILLCNDDWSSEGVIELNGASPEGSAMKISRFGQKQFYKFPSWLNNEWTDGVESFTIKNNTLLDPNRYFRKYAYSNAYDIGISPDWSITVGDNLITMVTHSNSRIIAHMYLDRNNKALGFTNADLTSVVQPLTMVKHYSSPMEILKDIYPASDVGSGISMKRVATERFLFYEQIECDHDVLLQTQDAYTYVDNPDPKFTKYDKMDNAYLVEWTQSADNPRQQLVVIFVQENGAWKIDNVIENPDYDQATVLFDYSKPPEPVYGDEAYSAEDFKRIEQIRKSLETKNEG